MKILCWLLFNIIATISIAQEYYEIKGAVLDEYRAPLAFANVFINETKVGTYTDEQGNFSLKTNISKGILLISHIGYKSDSISINRIKNTDSLNITLIEYPNIIRETTVVGNKRTSKRTLGFFDKRTNYTLSVGNGTVLALFVRNDINEEGTIKKLMVKFKKVKNNPLIRFRLYANNGTGQGPGTEIPTKIAPIQLKTNKKKLVVDISDFNFPFPLEGIFVGVEIVNGGYYDKNTGYNYPFFMVTEKENGYNTWMSFMGNNWGHSGLTKLSEGTPLNVKFGIEVLY